MTAPEMIDAFYAGESVADIAIRAGKDYADIEALIRGYVIGFSSAVDDILSDDEPTPRGEVVNTGSAREKKRLEDALLRSDGWRCDGCGDVFADGDPCGGEDCDLCELCAETCRTPELEPIP